MPVLRLIGIIAIPFLLSVSWTSRANDTSSSPPIIPTASNYALDGMAPAGRWAARLMVLRNHYDHRYDNAKKRVDMDAESNALIQGLGFTDATVDTRVTTEMTELMLGYGVTENLTVGMILPQVRTTSRIHLSGTQAPLLQATLSGLGYSPLQTTTSSGLGDPTVGALWRFQKSARDSALLGVGVRFGTTVDDAPNNLADIPPGDGSTDLRLRGEYFRDLGNGWDLRLMGEYQRQFSDTVLARPSLLSPPEILERDLGDFWETDIELGKSFGNWRVSGTWHRYKEAPDRYASRIGTNTTALSANTDTLADQLRLSLSWSGIQAWRAGRLFMPLIVKLEIQDAVAGRNFVDVRDVYLRITSFF